MIALQKVGGEQKDKGEGKLKKWLKKLVGMEKLIKLEVDALIDIGCEYCISECE